MRKIDNTLPQAPAMPQLHLPTMSCDVRWLSVFVLVAAQLCAAEETYSPAVGQDFPRQVFWGDTHLHSSYSFDAYPFGNTSIGPDEAFRFARGEQLISAGIGQPVQLRRPLDWLVVSDHAEYLGMSKALFEGNEQLRSDEDGARWYALAKAGKRIEAVMEIGNSIADREELLDDPQVKNAIWLDAARIADNNNEPGIFSAFIGFEWTSMPGTGDNLHRVVIFGDGAEYATQMLPFSAFDSEDPEQLWAWMSRYHQSTGGDILAIAHNGNTSNGLMFPDRTLDGRELDRAYATARARWEPLYEVTQIKGDGETHPKLSPMDDFADFETWDTGNITANTLKEDWMLKHEYARSGLLLGLVQQARLGVNPFSFGMIGSTDSHTGLSTADDDNFWGKMSTVEPMPARLTERFYGGKAFDVPTRTTSASGYTGVWASENSRASIFAALKRREVYATTGPRMTLRFFGGWQFQPQHALAPDLAATGYRLGVPMGGELAKAQANIAPSFLVLALKDPDGAKLDRVQVVKGWIDNAGAMQERVYDVAWSGDRAPGPTANCHPLAARWTYKAPNTPMPLAPANWPRYGGTRILKPANLPSTMRGYWKYQHRAGRTYDAVRFEQALPDDVPLQLQQRAYSSPIWYQPND